jgi:hypothetical protein
MSRLTGWAAETMPHKNILATLLCGAACFMIMNVAPDHAAAMQLAVAGDQLVLSGPVVGDELTKLDGALTDHPEVGTIILRNSPGGEARTGYRVGEMFRLKGLRTAVSGYCYSSCSRVFLGGKTRVFTDDYPPDYTDVGFHGHYDHGTLNVALVQALGLKDWIVKFSDGKADPASGRGATTFICQGNEPTPSVFACEHEARSALDLGVITSLDIISSNDQAALRATWLPRPAPSGFAAVAEVAKVPLAIEAGLQNYRRYLAAAIPKAFAISPDGKAWAWNGGTFDAMQLALARCAERAHQTCRLYAVDEDVVWPTGP